MFNNLFFSPLKSYRLLDNVKVYFRAIKTTDDNMAHELFMPDT